MLRAYLSKFSDLVFGLSFALTIVYHLCAILGMRFTEPSPLWRHLLFIFINLFLTAVLLRKQAAFTWLITALTLQQVYSHGTYGYEIFMTEHRIDWVSVIIFLWMPILLLFHFLGSGLESRASVPVVQRP